MTRIYLAVALALSLAIGGWQINKQRDIITDLQARIEQVEATREMELAHFNREIERQEEMARQNRLYEEIRNAAEQDTSDHGFMFSGSRLRRIDQLR